MKKCAEKLFVYTKQEILSYIFRCANRTSPKHFTRKSVLDFEKTMLIILRMVKKSIKAEVMDFFYRFNKELEIPSRQAFSQAREKISYLAFKDFFDKSCELAVNGDDDARLYKAYRLFAVDGTSFAVGSLRKLAQYFGDSTTLEGRAMCRISAVVDVLNDCIVNAAVSPFSTGERALAIGQIEELKAVLNALFLFDRGYWSPELVESIIGNGQKFLMRLASNTGKTIARDKSATEYELRRYSFVLPSGETEVLLTNLTPEEVSDDELAALYAKRWGVETKYLELKDRLQIDHFSGESVNVVLQDIYSTLYISNLVAFLCFESDEIINERTADKSNQYKQKTNRTTCITTLRNRFIDLCLLESPCQRARELQRLYDDVSKDVSYVNKSKSRPRNKRQIKESRKHKPKSFL